MDRIVRQIDRLKHNPRVTRERKAPYAHDLSFWGERADNLGEDIAARLQSALEMHDRGGNNCAAMTIAFTHPVYAERFDSNVRVPNLLLYALATELIEHSKEEIERGYYGQVENSNLTTMIQSDLEEYLEGSKAVWFGTADMKDSESSHNEEYSHMLGIIPAQTDGEFVVFDTSGQVRTLLPMSISDVYEGLCQLPVGEEYMQSIFSFRDKTS